LTLYGRAAVEAARILSLPLAVSPVAGDPVRLLRFPPDAPDAPDAGTVAELRAGGREDWRVSCTITPTAMQALPPASVALADALASYSDAGVAAWPTPGEWCNRFLGCCSDDPYPEDFLEAVADRVAAYEKATLGRWLVARDRLRGACAWLFRGPAPDDAARAKRRGDSEAARATYRAAHRIVARCLGHAFRWRSLTQAVVLHLVKARRKDFLA
jgi:hypothetical protein